MPHTYSESSLRSWWDCYAQGTFLAAEAPRDLTGSQYLRSSAAKKLQLSPANSASYAGYRKATRKGKKAKQRFEVKPGNLPRNLPSLLLDRKKQRGISSSPRTNKDERKEEGMSYSPLGCNLRLYPLPTFVLPRKKLFQWNLFGHWGISIQWTTPFRRHKICRPGQMFTKSLFLVPLFTEHLPWSRGCLLSSWDRDTSSYNWR